jgi:uncharacterized protein YbjT (DUF2867 family)
MKKVLVIGASGFVGRPLAKALLAEGHAVRCLARNPSKIHDLAAAGCEVVQGDIADLASLRLASKSVEAVYISIHTLSPQPANTAGKGFMDVEFDGLRNILTACRANGVRRLIYITFLGMKADSRSAWVRERAKAEQFLFGSGLDVTVIRPGQIVGKGGHGFNMMVSQAGKSPAIVMGNGTKKWRNIALGDLVYYLVGVLDEPRAYGQTYDVGCDDILTYNQMIDMTAEVLGRRPPTKIHLPLPLLSACSGLIERITKLPTGAIKGLIDSMDSDAIGNAMPIRAILPRPPQTYRQALERALTR